MAKPQTKNELLSQSEENYDKLLSLIKSLSADKLEGNFPKGTLNRNVKDVIMHLHSWHLLFLTWYKLGMKGEKPEMPASGYTWKTMPDLNKELWKKNKSVELKDGMKLFKASHKKVFKIIQTHSDKELFTKKMYPWTGSTSLGMYLSSNAASHYVWAIKLIKKNTK